MSVAIVTGAASGMGRACAERFVAEGWKVAALDRAEAELGGALAVAADVPDATAVGAAIERVVAELGAPKALVNAAGVYPPSTLETATVELYRLTFDVNVLGTLLVTQAAARPSGTSASAACMRPVVRLPGVSTQPGAIPFTRTRGPSSSASDFVSATTAAFEAQYNSWPGDGTNASIEAKFTIAA